MKIETHFSYISSAHIYLYTYTSIISKKHGYIKLMMYGEKQLLVVYDIKVRTRNYEQI